MNEQILISDSSPPQGRLLQFILRSAGYAVLLQYGFDALPAVLAEQPFDLVILDKHTPGQTPQHMCDECLRARSGIALLMCGLAWHPREVTEVARWGVANVIGGPPEAASVLAVVADALQRYRQRIA